MTIVAWSRKLESAVLVSMTSSVTAPAPVSRMGMSRNLAKAGLRLMNEVEEGLDDGLGTVGIGHTTVHQRVDHDLVLDTQDQG